MQCNDQIPGRPSDLALRTSAARSDPYKDDLRPELLGYDLITQMMKIHSIETFEEKGGTETGHGERRKRLHEAVLVFSTRYLGILSWIGVALYGYLCS